MPKFMTAPMVVLAALFVVFGIFPHLGFDIVGPAQQSLVHHGPYIKEVLGAIP